MAEQTSRSFTRTFPLNFKRLTAEVLSRIAEWLGLPTNASAAETRQLIDRKLEEYCYEPRNVQVDLIEQTDCQVAIKLGSEDGEIANIPAEESQEQPLPAHTIYEEQ